MREIKFRGKDDKGNWVYGYPIIVLYKAWIKDISDTTTNPRRLGRDFADFRCVEVEKETVGQYTGLKDKNGKDIYEGDVHGIGDCTFEVRHGSYTDDRTLEESYGWHVYDERDGTGCNLGESEIWVNIIGNIHENPELLGVPHE